MTDVETGTAAEITFRSLAYAEIGVVPRYGQNPHGEIKGRTFFYKDLA
jgi:hypothetical protein